MENYKSGSHTRHDLKAHVVWITKYRKGVLSGEIARRVREIIRQECSVMEVEILRGHVSRDHIHLLVGYGPSLSVSKLVQRLKGEEFVAAAPGISGDQKEVLGTTDVGEGIFRGQQRERDGRGDRGIHCPAGQRTGDGEFQDQR